MTQPISHPAPPLREVLGEQVRAVGHALRRPALAAAALLAVGTLLLTIELVREPNGMSFGPENQMLPGVLGLLFPVAVWHGEKRFGDAFLWTLPVDRRQHALAKVFGGWVWLMAAIAFFMLWLAVLTFASGGSFLAEETRRLVAVSHEGPVRLLHVSMLRTIRWTPQPVLWIVPFTAATGTYLLSSALVLGVKHPLRWIAGVVLAFLLITISLEVTNVIRYSLGTGRLLNSFHSGPYGFDALLTARTESLRTEVFLTDGQRVLVWLGLPHLGQWAAATVGWTMGGLLALWAAASRHRERRRP